MFPDYPSIKTKVNSLLIRYVRHEMVRYSPILREIRQTVQHEGHEHAYGDVDGRESPIDYQEAAARFSLTRDEMRRSDFQPIMSKFAKMAETFATQQSKMLFATVSKVTASTGNVVATRGGLSKETFLEMERKRQWSFNPQTGEPRPPALVLDPDTLAKIKNEWESWQQDSEFKAALSAIEQQQRLAWRDRESRRRLAD
ncbi:MAG: hypothetical protein F4205_08420 [Gemmatimonadetes bacterium]|nr:hypothetical protein [Gemmatimonadota bacterium]MYG35505.1 hypothetical protein [Gemmatimonadota bacterium]